MVASALVIYSANTGQIIRRTPAARCALSQSRSLPQSRGIISSARPPCEAFQRGRLSLGGSLGPSRADALWRGSQCSTGALSRQSAVNSSATWDRTCCPMRRCCASMTHCPQLRQGCEAQMLGAPCSPPTGKAPRVEVRGCLPSGGPGTLLGPVRISSIGSEKCGKD